MIDIHDELVAETATVGDEVGIMITTAAPPGADNDGLERVACAGDEEHVAGGAGDEAEGKIVAARRCEAATALFDGESEVGNEDEVALAVAEAARATQE